MKKNYIILIAVLILLYGFLEFSNKVHVNLEKDGIMSVAKNMIIDDFNDSTFKFKGELIEESVKVHTVEEINNKAYILYSYNYKFVDPEEELLHDEFYNISLNRLMRDNSEYGYTIGGGFGSGGDIKATTITASSSGNKAYGLILDDKVAELLIEYQDGKVISYDARGKDYYLVNRDESEELIPTKIIVLDENGDTILEY